MICKIADELSLEQLNEKYNDDEQAEIKADLCKHFATCEDKGCKECLENRVNIGIQTMNGKVISC